MYTLKSAAQMRQTDNTAMYGKYSIAPAVLMENAGRAVAERGRAYVGGWDDKDVLILCGKGNNGGDGFVIARHILAAGGRVYVYSFGTTAEYSEESKAHLHTLRMMCDNRTCTLTMYEGEKNDRLLYKRLAACDVLIDALLGTGFSGSLREPLARVVAAVNERAAAGGCAVIAVDMPTGVNTDTGAVSDDIKNDTSSPLMADLTVTFGSYKRGQFIYPGKACIGKLELDSIGLPPALLTENAEDNVYLLCEADITEIVTPRRADSHKGTHGTIGIVTGCGDMVGAALMTAHGAVRSGAGKVFLRVPGAAAPYCIGKEPEIMVRPVGGRDRLHFCRDDAAEVIAESKDWSVLVMGPGMGKDKELPDFIDAVAAETTCPLVLDADALNALRGKEADFFARHGGRTVITPHLLEFSRLSGLATAEIKTDLIAAVMKFVRDYAVTVVLKGAPSLIASAKTGNIYVNETGNAGMAAGGMGDVLSGIIAAMIAHDGIGSIAAAACAAVYLHGAAGDYCAGRIGPYGFTPDEVADAVPEVLALWDKRRPLILLEKPYIM